MTNTFFFDAIGGKDTHANRPATFKKGGLYSCSTHNLVYRWDGAAWQTWATLAGLAVLPAGGTTGQVLAKNTGTDYDTGWATQTSTKVINAQTGTSYTAVLADANRTAWITMTNAASSTLTIPPNASVAFPVGAVIEGSQMGVGQVTLTPGSGVTINGTPGLKVAAQYGTFAVLQISANTWLAMGRLSA